MGAVLDTCGWLAYFLNEPLAPRYAPLINGPTEPIVSIVSIYEVYKVLARNSGPVEALRHADYLWAFPVDSLSLETTILAADLSAAHKLHMSDALIYATAVSHQAELWTHDTHFQGLPGVHFVTP